MSDPDLSVARFFARHSAVVAPELLGTTLLVNGVGGIIVEVEAYDPQDPASHSFAGPTPRNQAMFGPPARAYVYRSYGIHWCLNFVCGDAGAVLIRALEPTAGIEAMRRRRGLEDLRALCSGPGKLCTALGVTGQDNGRSLLAPPFSLDLPASPAVVMIGRRIGISKAVDIPWRFGVRGSRFLSKRFARDE
ncbi:MAG: DNA-3-methyladenine glycosylase [Devosia sp.]|nr:DNA-3-methyladenine glycosylase [Devosia sp.]